jgi:uncharacterized protein YjeT (DUF2065 family)
MITLAAILVLLTGLYLVGLAAFSFIYPTRAIFFLESFANSAFNHVLELSLRIIAGAAVLVYAPYMKFSDLFRAFGWVLVTTTVALFVMPWRWHRHFAQLSVPFATQRLGLFALGSLAMGIFIVLSVIFGIAI